MKQHVNSKKTFMAICLSPFNLPTCDPDNNKERKDMNICWMHFRYMINVLIIDDDNKEDS